MLKIKLTTLIILISAIKVVSNQFGEYFDFNYLENEQTCNWWKIYDKNCQKYYHRISRELVNSYEYEYKGLYMDRCYQTEKNFSKLYYASHNKDKFQQSKQNLSQIEFSFKSDYHPLEKTNIYYSNYRIGYVNQEIKKIVFLVVLIIGIFLIYKTSLNYENLSHSARQNKSSFSISLFKDIHVSNQVGSNISFYKISPLMIYITKKSKSETNLQYQLDNQHLIDSLTRETDFNVQNLDGETALHLAVKNGFYEISKALINQTDLNLFDKNGFNILHTAVSSNQYEILELILENCDQNLDYIINSKTNDLINRTSMIIAARLNYNSIIRLLIDFNADLNLTDHEGRSALHWCAKVNNFNGALLLIQAGANVNLRDVHGKTPLSLALCEISTLDVAELLIIFDAYVGTDDELKYKKIKKSKNDISNSGAYQIRNQLNAKKFLSNQNYNHV